MNHTTDTFEEKLIDPQTLLDAIPMLHSYQERVKTLALIQQVLVMGGTIPTVLPARDDDADDGMVAVASLAYMHAVRRIRGTFTEETTKNIATNSLIVQHDRDMLGLMVEVQSSCIAARLVNEAMDDNAILPKLVDLFSGMNARQRVATLCAVVALRADKLREDQGELELFATPDTINDATEYDPVVNSASFSIIELLINRKCDSDHIMRIVEACYKAEGEDQSGSNEIQHEVNDDEEGNKVIKLSVTRAFGSDIILDALAPIAIIEHVLTKFTAIVAGYGFYALGNTNALQDEALERYRAITPDPESITVDNAIPTCLTMLEEWAKREVESKRKRRQIQRMIKQFSRMSIDPSVILKEDGDDGKDEERAH